MVITIGTIICVAIFGLFVINVDPAGADRGIVPTSSGSESVSGTSETSSTSSILPDSDVTGAILKMVSALVIVIVAVYAGLYLLRKAMGKKYAGTASDALEVLQTTYVGQNKAISLVRVADRSVLVGVTESQISAITELSVEETERIRATVGSTAANAPSESFARLLNMASEKLKGLAAIKKQAALDNRA